MTTLIQIKAVGASAYSEVAKKDFLGALENCDSVNDIIDINGTSYNLSTVIFCDCELVTTTNTTTTSSAADTYTATGTAGAVVLSPGLRVALDVNYDNTGAATVNFDGTGAKAIQSAGAAIDAGVLRAGQTYPLTYDGTAFQLYRDIAPVKKYKALLTQAGAAAPTVVVLENTIGAIVWTRTSAGVFAGTLANAFVANKTTCELQRDTNNFIANTASVITVTTKDAINVVQDSLLSSTKISLEVYP